MSPISSTLSKTLSALEAVIAEAEDRLKRMPGAGEAWYDCDEDGEYGLVFRAGRVCRLDAAERHVARPIAELPVSERIELAQMIPGFFVAAQDAEADVVEKADRAVYVIEQAIAEVDK